MAYHDSPYVFKDRASYRIYKKINKHVRGRSSRFSYAFTVGLNEHLMDAIEQQFKNEGYYTKNTRGVPLTEYNAETKKVEQVIILEVGTSQTIVSS